MYTTNCFINHRFIDNIAKENHMHANYGQPDWVRENMSLYYALGLFLHPVLVLDKFGPDVSLWLNGDSVLVLDAPFQSCVPGPITKSNPKWWWHCGATMRTNSSNVGTGTLEHPSVGTGMVPGWAMTCILLVDIEYFGTPPASCNTVVYQVSIFLWMGVHKFAGKVVYVWLSFESFSQEANTL